MATRDKELRLPVAVAWDEGRRFGFVRIEQTVRLEADDGHQAAALSVVARAEDGCLVTACLDIPVHTTAEVRTATSSAQ
jgi:hypothetical protein